jgi:hypothetical protein
MYTSADSTHLCRRTSTDGFTWSSEQVVFDLSGYVNYTYFVSACGIMINGIIYMIIRDHLQSRQVVFMSADLGINWALGCDNTDNWQEQSLLGANYVFTWNNMIYVSGGTGSNLPYVAMYEITGVTVPSITNLTRNNARGSATIAVGGTTYITTATYVSPFGGSEITAGSITGSGTIDLNFSAVTVTDIIPGFTLAAPVMQVDFQTTDGFGNYSQEVSVFLCSGFILTNPGMITDYVRNETSATFTLSGLGVGDSGVVEWNTGEAMTAQVVTNGSNTITGLTASRPYSFMLFTNNINGTLGLSTWQFGDAGITSNPVLWKITNISPNPISLSSGINLAARASTIFYIDSSIYKIFTSNVGPSSLGGLTKGILEQLGIVQDLMDLVDNGDIVMVPYYS